MSKEQTPISFLFCETNAPEFSDELDLICESYLVIANIMEQYAKVLEALEREFSEVAVDWGQLSMMNGKEYYETEVKPKYER